MTSDGWGVALALILGAGGTACQGLNRIGVPAEVPAEHLAFKARARAPSRAEDLEFLNACVSQRMSSDIVFTDAGITGNWDQRTYSETTVRLNTGRFVVPWDSVIQLVPQVDCTVRGNCDSPALWEAGRMLKLTAWRQFSNANTQQEEWTLVTVAMPVEGCEPADVLVALGHFVGPDRIVGCGRNCRAALGGGSPR